MGGPDDDYVSVNKSVERKPSGMIWKVLPRCCRPKTKTAKLLLLILFCSCVFFVLKSLTSSSGSHIDIKANNFSLNQITRGRSHHKNRGHKWREHPEDIQFLVCRHPKLDLKHDVLQDAFYKMDPLQCKGSNLFYMSKGVLKLNNSVISPTKISKCNYRGVEWMQDNYGSVTDLLTKEKLPFDIIPKHDFLHISCFRNDLSREEPEKLSPAHPHFNSTLDSDSEETLSDEAEFMEEMADQQPPDFEQFLVHVYPKPDIFSRISKLKPNPDSMEMNVLIIALDSMSRMSFMRKLPKTYKYLEKHLKSVIMTGYNIVGDATTAAIIPMLTGKSETELPETRKNQMDSTYVDAYPLIWNEFEENGYVTMFAEDEPSLGVFNLRLNGFETVPTDHYMRPFWQVLWESKLRESSPRYCTGDMPHHQYSLQYVKDFFHKYSNISKFAFVFHGELTHWDNNPGEYIDEDLLNTLQHLESNNFLNNTLLFVMGDHGARYSMVRNTVQGKLEERLPMMSLYFPPWFRKKFSSSYKNLANNAKKLATPFDIHETLLDVLDVTRLTQPVRYNKRGISLLRAIPFNRTCSIAGIAMHWCACLQQESLDVTSEHVKMSAGHVLSVINKETEPHRELCSELKLRKILDANLVVPNEKVLKFISSKDDDHRVANFSKSINMDVAHYQITLETTPNDALYEATVQYIVSKDKYLLSRSDISRLNVYGKQPACIEKKFPHLSKYCFCESSQTSTHNHK